MFPCSLMGSPKQCWDRTAHEPPSEETDRPVLARVSEMCLQGPVLFLNTGFGVEKGLWSRECSEGHRVPISSLISVAAPLFFLSPLWSWNSSSRLLLMACALLVLLLLMLSHTCSFCCCSCPDLILLVRVPSSYIQLLCFLLILSLPRIFVLVQIMCWLLICVVFSCLLFALCSPGSGLFGISDRCTGRWLF